MIMGCIAQVCPTPVPAECVCPEINNNGCDPFIWAGTSTIEMKNITCCILHGKVECNDGTALAPTPVKDAIVYAKQVVGERPAFGYPEYGEVFAGVTNDCGVYCICVPCGDYDIFAFCCDGDCCSDYCPTDSCNCGGGGGCGGC